jgi:hypothetical protein
MHHRSGPAVMEVPLLTAGQPSEQAAMLPPARTVPTRRPKRRRTPGGWDELDLSFFRFLLNTSTDLDARREKFDDIAFPEGC